MTTLKLLCAALALAVPTTAWAAGCADMACCKEKDCCKDKDGKKSDCCADMKDAKDGDHAGHDMSGMPKK